MGSQQENRFENVPPPPGSPSFKALATRHAGNYEPQTLGECWEMAQALCRATVVPEAYRSKPSDVLYCILFGRELGMSSVQALQNVAVVNGRATIWGDMPLAIVRQRAGHLLETFKETWEPERDGGTWTTTIKRRDDDELIVRSFSVNEAKRINVREGKMLADKDVWKNYPRRMCKFKARNEALRDGFPEFLLGIASREDADEWGEAIDAEVVRSEHVTNDQAVAERLGRLDDEQMSALVQGFQQLNMSAGQQLAKLRAYEGHEADLVDWLRDEWMKRRSHGLKGYTGGKKAESAATATSVETAADTQGPAAEDAQTDDAAGAQPGPTSQSVATAAPAIVL